MPDENPQFDIGSLVWVWADTGRWRSGTVIEAAESAMKVRLSKIHHPHHIEVDYKFLLPRDFDRHGADRPRGKPQQG